MQGAEYQALAMRTNDKKSTDRLLNKINDLKIDWQSLWRYARD